MGFYVRFLRKRMKKKTMLAVWEGVDSEGGILKRKKEENGGGVGVCKRII